MKKLSDIRENKVQGTLTFINNRERRQTIQYVDSKFYGLEQETRYKDTRGKEYMKKNGSVYRVYDKGWKEVKSKVGEIPGAR